MKESQNIKNTLDRDVVIELLRDMCIESEENILLFNKTAYKRLRLFNKITPILKKLKPYYYESKMFYLTRKMNYKTFSTIVRQLCKYANLKLLSNIRYLYSSYIIEYTIIM